MAELLARSHRTTKFRLVLKGHTTTLHLAGVERVTGGGQMSYKGITIARMLLSCIQTSKAIIPFGNIKEALLGVLLLLLLF